RRARRPEKYLAEYRFRRISHIAGRKRLWKNHASAPYRRFRTTHDRRNLDVRRAVGHAAALQAPRKHRFSELCPVPALECARQRCLRLARARRAERRNRWTRRRSTEHGENVGIRERTPVSPQRRPAAARGSCPRINQLPATAASRRTALRARCQSAQANAK